MSIVTVMLQTFALQVYVTWNFLFIFFKLYGTDITVHL